MLINPVSLIAGALSFSAALAWNKAISDTLNKYTATQSPIFQASIITIIIIISVYLINIGIKIYTNKFNVKIHNHIINNVNKKDGKIKLLID